MSLSIPLPLGWLLNKKAAKVEVNISLAFLHWVEMALHPWPLVSDIAIFVLKGDVKLELTSKNEGVDDLSMKFAAISWGKAERWPYSFCRNSCTWYCFLAFLASHRTFQYLSYRMCVWVWHWCILDKLPKWTVLVFWYESYYRVRLLCINGYSDLLREMMIRPSWRIILAHFTRLSANPAVAELL